MEPLEFSPEDLQELIKAQGLTHSDLNNLITFLGSGAYEKYSDFTHQPVTIDEFVSSKEFLGASGYIYPAVLDELREINNGNYVEAVFTGGVGSGKTTAALYTIAYQLYLLSCMKHPNEAFGLDPFSEIVFVFQNKTATLAKTVDYSRFKNMILQSPYFRHEFPFDKDIKSELRFPKNIVVKPVSGDPSALLGQNVFGGIIDEINFMEVIDKSKRSIDGGTYDQAYALYNTIARRRLSRFLKHGALPGMLCLVSSRRYPGQFTDQKEAEARRQIEETGKSNIYIYDKRAWDVKPPGSFSDEWFYVFAGDETRKPYVLHEDDDISEKDNHLVHKIPMDFYSAFESDIVNALRDIAGVSTLAVSPFLMDREAVLKCFGAHKSILSRTDADFKDTFPEIVRENIFHPEALRWIHIDLSLSSDSTGIAMGCPSGFTEIKRGDEVELLPIIRLDFVLEVKPPRGGEIDFGKIRELIYKLSDAGFNIRWVTFDAYQSVDSSQLLRHKGFCTGIVSIDKTTAPYDALKTALYDHRVMIPHHTKLARELISLEWDRQKGKIDHPPRGSKDLADSLAGVVFHLSIRRETWAFFNLNPMDAPRHIWSIASKYHSEDELKQEE